MHLEEVKQKWKELPLPVKILAILVAIACAWVFNRLIENLAWLLI